MSTRNYTDAEQAFIDASAHVHEAADEVRRAVEDHAALAEKAFNIGLETLDDRMEDVEYVHGLQIAAAHQAGFGDDSHIVRGINQALQQYRGFEAAQAAAASSIELPPGVDVNPDDGLVM